MWNKIKDLTNDILGIRNEAAESLQEALKDRLISPFYGYFVISWFLVNWDYVYTAFFVKEDLIFQKTHLLRNEFILQNILPQQHNYIWMMNFIVFPLLFTTIAIWIMPLLTNKFYAQHLVNINRQEKTRMRALKKSTIEETELIEEKVKKAEIEKIAENVNPEINWERDFEKLKASKLYKKFHQITDSFYKFNAMLQVNKFSVDTDILIYADSHKLIELNEDQYGNRTFLPTEKGKHFFKLFVEDPESFKGEQYKTDGSVSPF